MHRNLLSTGGGDGCINHYLLDEQNPPTGTAPSLSPYDSPDPANAPAQTIYPAHTVPHAHDFAIWSMDWHPLGHILASGSNDRVTRFWTRPRPGDSSWTNDRYHIGQDAAEKQGTYDRRDGRRQQREQEEEEAEDEAEGLVDQKMPAKQAGPPGLPGISLTSDGTSTGGAQLPGIGGAAPLPQSMPFAPPPMPPFDPTQMDMTKVDMSRLAQMFGGQVPPPPNGMPGQFPPPPGFPGPPSMPNMPGMPPMPSAFHPSFPPAPPGFQAPIPPPGGVSMPGLSPTPSNGAAGAAGNLRQRKPLPSQQESLQAEIKQGRYRKAR